MTGQSREEASAAGRVPALTERAEWAVALLGRTAAIALLALIAVTWRLWTPQTIFPRIPLLGGLRGLPEWTEWAAFIATCVSLVVEALISPRHKLGRGALLVTVAAICFLVLTDQHRLQPWAYQLSLVSLLLACLPAAEAIAANRLLVVSIYFYSAVSKLDRTFIESGGGQIADGLNDFLHRIDPRLLVPSREVVGWLMPVAELLIAAGLCCRPSRKAALVGSVMMHVALIAALGPLGAGNKPGVLVWNAFFIVQNVILFGVVSGRMPRVTWSAIMAGRFSNRLMRLGAWAVLAFALVFPATQPFGWCDVWPAWAVYAPGPERLDVLVNAADGDRIPTSVRPYVWSPRLGGLSHLGAPCVVQIDRWSLEAMGAPIYPQNRFRLGIALALADAGAIEDISVRIESSADRWTGKRTSRTLTGTKAIAAELERHWLNGFPR